MKKKKGLTWRLAVTGIKKNSKLYLPYILAGIGMVAIFYIMLDLAESGLTGLMRGGTTLTVILYLGVIVLGLFSLLMLFYTNSFLTKTRTKEFGLYNILGMDRRNISKVLVAETAITGAISLAGGLLCGILLSKLAETFLARLLGVSADYELRIDMVAIGVTFIVFTAFFIAVMLKNIITISRRKTIDLLKNDRLGEKPPKGSILVTIIGLVLLGIAYYIAVSIKNPLSAILNFFYAVILVIIATTILFVIGSVTLCKVLQKKKGYYYKTNHFVSLSSMSFRMKRNGVGLAEICILSTMVLVMIASTSCLYFGKESLLDSMYPREMTNTIDFYDMTSEGKSETKENIKNLIQSAAEKNGLRLKNEADFEYQVLHFGDLGEGALLSGENMKNIDRITEINTNASWDLFFISLDEYNRYMNSEETLSENEAICCEFGDRYPFDSVAFTESSTVYNIKRRTSGFYNIEGANSTISSKAVFVIKELPEEYVGVDYASDCKWEFDFDYEFIDGRQLNDEEKLSAAETFCNQSFNYDEVKGKNFNFISWICMSKEQDRYEFFGMYSGLFFLGIVLSMVFICALGLMIYYKQISEGYEDRSRFEIMKKVGMTEKDIRNSINSQMGTVFYLPLAVATVHLGFAFPMIYRCLRLFGVTYLQPLLITSLISVAVFAVIYAIVYKVTSNSYYRIVK